MNTGSAGRPGGNINEKKALTYYRAKDRGLLKFEIEISTEELQEMLTNAMTHKNIFFFSMCCKNLVQALTSLSLAPFHN